MRMKVQVQTSKIIIGFTVDVKVFAGVFSGSVWQCLAVFGSVWQCLAVFGQMFMFVCMVWVGVGSQTDSQVR